MVLTRKESLKTNRDIKNLHKETESFNSGLENYQLFFRYGYFYYQYNKDSFYYEIVYMFKRIVYIVYNLFIIPLISVHTKYDSNITSFINLEILFIWIFFLIHMIKQPFRDEISNINRLETVSSLIILTSFFFSALFFHDVDPKYYKDNDVEIINYILDQSRD